MASRTRRSQKARVYLLGRAGGLQSKPQRLRQDRQPVGFLHASSCAPGQLGWVHRSHSVRTRPEDPRIEYLLWTGASLPHFYILKCNFSSALETIDGDGSLPLCPCVQVPTGAPLFGDLGSWYKASGPVLLAAHTLSKGSTRPLAAPPQTHITHYMPPVVHCPYSLSRSLAVVTR